ncbi:pyridoxamine 5'-phosphate oxidase family protein [Cyanobacterium stanieri LEGE 03274]|uniref:Pyridoxamine 5'-phosphate oxidase family protein n=1 Tax=Cyanobacterium stanieri LEGE 03274 TaxID=1828756 RepID=A0ABR9V7B7_9CHRO|nr:Npun_F5749 family FMN-dependent PPOX-type flavoprotein [Cyanobacterium stanieri]MBE9222724.1 pyridoxamine 5'-phosphate oxidase family protein [Cyanobacterium stanieri LEGE 03274]
MTNIAPWRSPLAKALHLNRAKPHSRYFQIATINPEGFPHNRTVVFRGFYADTNNLQIITDIRSEKYQHLQKQPQSEICWYFTKTREQFRIQGLIDIITYQENNKNMSHARQQAWEKLSDNAKIQFTWPTPGEKVIKEYHTATDSLEQPLDTFCLLILKPQKVDHLQLKGNPQNRYRYHLDEKNNWVITAINP